MAPRPDIKLLPVSHPLGRKVPQQDGCFRRRWATYIVLYNNVHYGEQRLHYEVSHMRGQAGWELGFHCEAHDKRLNRFLLDGFRRNLFEIKDALGQSIEAEMWDRGWTKIYELYPDETMTPAYQARVGLRMAAIITCLHPIYVDLRNAVAQSYR